MNSKTGFGPLIGKETGKVVAFGTRNTSCRTYNIAERKGKEAKSHDCRKTGLNLRRQWSLMSK